MTPGTDHPTRTLILIRRWTLWGDPCLDAVAYEGPRSQGFRYTSVLCMARVGTVFFRVLTATPLKRCDFWRFVWSVKLRSAAATFLMLGIGVLRFCSFCDYFLSEDLSILRCVSYTHFPIFPNYFSLCYLLIQSGHPNEYFVLPSLTGR